MGGEGGCVGPLQALFGVRVGRDSLMRRGAPRVWLPPAKFRSEIWGVSHRHRPLRPAGGRGTARRVVVPYGWLRRAAAIALGSGAQRSVCGADGRNGWESRQRSPQKCPATPDNPSVGLWPTAPFAQGSLRGGGYGLPRRPCGPPRNDNGFLSFRGAGRCGNPSFLRWTGIRAAEVVGPYGKPNQPPKPAGAQRSVRARGCEGWAGIDAKTIPKGGTPP